MLQPSKKFIYLDHAATTPVRDEVLHAVQPYESQYFGNPSSLYKQGMQARQALAIARQSVAGVLGVLPEEVVFTAGGTESANLAILGAARAYRKTHKTGGHIITSQIEHHAVLRACQRLEIEGFAVTYINVDPEGFFDVKDVKSSIRKDTVLLSLMYANNEIGTIEPIIEIGKLVKKLNSERPPKSARLLFHTDACQAAGSLEIHPQTLGVDLLTLNASKIYGPKQVGCLYIRKGVEVEPLLYGGGQERGLRSGTENVGGIVGFAKALELAQNERAQETKRLALLRDYCVAEICKRIPEVKLNGPLDELNTTQKGRPLRRLPNNINLQLPAEGEAVMLYLDAYNIATATGSACATESGEPSHVLKAIGLTDAEAKNCLRITLGRATTKQQLAYLLKVLPQVVTMVKTM